MDRPTYPTELTNDAESTLKDAVDAIAALDVENRVYVDDPESTDKRVLYDYDNQPYYVDGTMEMCDDSTVELYDGDAVMTFHFNGTHGHFFDDGSLAADLYDEMATAGLSKPTDNPAIGVQIRGNDIYVQNVLEDATP